MLEKSCIVKSDDRTPSIFVSAAASTFKARHATKTSMRNSRVSKVHGGKQFSVGNARRAPSSAPTGGPRTDRHGRSKDR